MTVLNCGGYFIK